MENDLVRIHNEGKQICREIEPNLVLQKDKKSKKYEEVQKGVKGKIIPIPMIQQQYFQDELNRLERLNTQCASLESEIEERWDGLEDDTKSSLAKDDGSENCKMDIRKISAGVGVILSGLSFPETEPLEEYLKLRGRQEKQDFIGEHPEIGWGDMKPNKDKTYGAAQIKVYIELRKFNREFDTDTEEGRIITIQKKITQKSMVGKEIKKLSKEMEEKAIEKILSLTDGEVDDMLVKKWIDPVIGHIDEDVKQVMMKLVKGLERLKEKYA